MFCFFFPQLKAIIGLILQINNGIVSATERKMPSFNLTVNAAIKNSVSILSHNDCLKGQEQDSLFFYFDSQADGLNTF